MGEPQNDKKLRSEYRALLEKAKHNKFNLVSIDNNQLQETIQEMNDLQTRVSKPREQAVDSELFAVVTEAGFSYVNKLASGGKSYTPADFIRRLKSHYVYDTDAQTRGAVDPTAFDWATVGRTVARFFKPAPEVFHMLGPMDARPKERKQVVRQKRKAQVGEAVRPEELENIGDSEKQETDKNMEEMWGVLRAQQGRANLMQLVMNHQSFSQTVENLFTLSFLVRDQRVELHDTEGGTEVVMRQKGASKQDGGNERERVQFVIALDIEAWELWREVVDPATALMRHRPEHHHAGGAADLAAGGGAAQREQEEEEEEEEEEERPPPSSQAKRNRRR